MALAMAGKPRSPDDMPFPIPMQIGMWQVCRTLRISRDEYLALPNEDAEWAHAMLQAEADAAKMNDKGK